MVTKGVMSKESELHRKTQRLRSDYADYIKDLRTVRTDFGLLNRVNIGINNKFVEILILNELIHEKKKTKKLM